MEVYGILILNGWRYTTMTDGEKQFVSIMMSSLNEKERRIFLGAYSDCLGHGGITDLSNLTGMSRSTITIGRNESREIKADPKARVTSTAFCR